MAHPPNLVLLVVEYEGNVPGVSVTIAIVHVNVIISPTYTFILYEFGTKASPCNTGQTAVEFDDGVVDYHNIFEHDKLA